MDIWQGMPEFVQEDLESKYRVVINFEREEDIEEFNKKTGLNIKKGGKKTYYYPPRKLKRMAWVQDGEFVPNRYSINIISKGRWDRSLTAKCLDLMGVDYKVYVEPNEYDRYAQYISVSKLVKLPENFSELGCGSIPVRNWVWEQSLKRGERRHWILDDNIRWFSRLNRNAIYVVLCNGTFRAMEDLVDRYLNVGLAGFEYRQFGGGSRRKKPPIKMNHRVYSCILIDNSLPFRWRGRYNEDTDLCLRVLKAGYCTMVSYAFLQSKVATMTMRGGNTDTVYAKDRTRWEFANSLKEQHPDCVEVVRRYGRWHHKVNYGDLLKNKLIRDNSVKVDVGVNEYGMKLVPRDDAPLL